MKLIDLLEELAKPRTKSEQEKIEKLRPGIGKKETVSEYTARMDKKKKQKAISNKKYREFLKSVERQDKKWELLNRIFSSMKDNSGEFKNGFIVPERILNKYKTLHDVQKDKEILYPILEYIIFDKNNIIKRKYNSLYGEEQFDRNICYIVNEKNIDTFGKNIEKCINIVKNNPDINLNDFNNEVRKEKIEQSFITMVFLNNNNTNTDLKKQILFLEKIKSSIKENKENELIKNIITKAKNYNNDKCENRKVIKPLQPASNGISRADIKYDFDSLDIAVLSNEAYDELAEELYSSIREKYSDLLNAGGKYNDLYNKYITSKKMTIDDLFDEIKKS